MADAPALPGRDLAGYLVRYPEEVAFGDEDPAVVFDRYHTPDFLLRNDGLPLDRAKLLAHMRPARRNTTTVDTVVHEVVVAGDRVAARYTLRAVLRRGRTVTTEIYLFGRVGPDGRLTRVDQVTRAVPADAGQDEVSPGGATGRRITSP
jgi:SnoaL-like protein